MRGQSRVKGGGPGMILPWPCALTVLTDSAASLGRCEYCSSWRLWPGKCYILIHFSALRAKVANY